MNLQVRKEPKEVQKERQLEAAAANAAQRAKQRESADKKTRMKVRTSCTGHLLPVGAPWCSSSRH